MDVATFRESAAGLIGQLFVLDPTTGLPTATPINALARVPKSIPDDKVPCTAIIISGAGRYPVPPPVTMDRLYPETRDFAIEFYIARAEAGVDFWAEEQAEPYLDYTRDWLQSHPQLWDGVLAHQPHGDQRAYTVSDSGLTSRLRFTTATVKYLGIVYMVRVEEYNKVNYYGQ